MPNIKELCCFVWLPKSEDWGNAAIDGDIFAFFSKVVAALQPSFREKATRILVSQAQMEQIINDVEVFCAGEIAYIDALRDFMTERLYDPESKENEGFEVLDAIENKPHAYYQWQNGQSEQINGKGLDDIAIEFSKGSNQENSTLILLGDLPIKCDAAQEFCCVIKDKQPHETHLPNTKDLPIFIKIPIIEGSESAINEWLEKHRKKRVFNDVTNHPRKKKVGKDGEKNYLVYDTSKPTEANKRIKALLDTAVGDKRNSDNPDKVILFNWDESADGGHYIVFEDEAVPQNTYHAYHLIATEMEEIRREKKSFTKEIFDLIEKRKS